MSSIRKQKTAAAAQACIWGAAYGVLQLQRQHMLLTNPCCHEQVLKHHAHHHPSTDPAKAAQYKHQLGVIRIALGKMLQKGVNSEERPQQLQAPQKILIV
jgi:hypothetical protein